QSGIDIEPNNASALIDGALVYVSGAEFKSNVHRGILTSGTPASGSINLVVSGCVFSGNSVNAIETVHDLVVSGCVFVDCNGSDVAAIQQNSGTGTATKTVVTGCQFTDCDQYAVRSTTDKTTVISDCIVRNSKGLVTADNGNLVVSGCIVESPTTTALALSQAVGNTSVTGCVIESTQNFALFVNTPGYVNVTGCTFTGDNSQVIRCVRGNVNAQSNLFASAGLALYMDEAGDTSILANNRMEGMDNPYFSAAAGEVVTFSNVVDGVATQVSNSVQAYGAV
ncbi:MAG: right-handed parallel beta-helix repeat-containing protein, partial [Fuerstiella sp.]|nr:right-handed parallel beta-helix repeat-containing protein [Fuerstiella sp.]